MRDDTNQQAVDAIISEFRQRLPSLEELTTYDPADVTDIGPDITVPAIWLSIVLANHDYLRLSSSPRSINTAPKDGGWILGHVPKNAEEPYRQPWVILTWGDAGWHDNEGNGHDPVEWIPLPDPQPQNTGWMPPSGVIQMVEITGEGWTCNGQPADVPWRWIINIEKEDGTIDAYRDCDMAVTVEEAEARALRWQAKYGLPIVRIPLAGNVIPFRPRVTRQ